MNTSADIRRVLACYPVDCRSGRIEAFGSAGGFSGARLWRIAAPRGLLVLRRWPKEHPDARRLEFIHAVLWHVAGQGLGFVAPPIRTDQGASHVRKSGYLWELTPWLPGTADYFPERRPTKLAAALTAFAQFHLAAASFAIAPSTPAVSPGIAERLTRLEELRSGRLQDIVAATADCETASEWHELAMVAPRAAEMFERLAHIIADELAAAARLAMALQPCLRDVWHEHVLFEGDQVTGLIDFGAMRSENVAADVARLLGSMASDDLAASQTGLAAYEAVRRLSADERWLVGVFDHSTTLLAAFNWLQWVFIEGRTFAEPAAATARVREIVARMQALSGTGTP